MKAKGKLGCACKLTSNHGMAAATYPSTEHREFIIPELAVNGIIMGIGLVTGLVGWNKQDTPVGRILLGAGGGLTALGITFMIREIFTAKGS